MWPCKRGVCAQEWACNNACWPAPAPLLWRRTAVDLPAPRLPPDPAPQGPQRSATIWCMARNGTHSESRVSARLVAIHEKEGEGRQDTGKSAQVVLTPLGLNCKQAANAAVHHKHTHPAYKHSFRTDGNGPAKACPRLGPQAHQERRALSFPQIQTKLADGCYSTQWHPFPAQPATSQGMCSLLPTFNDEQQHHTPQ